jgi:hypothetical protein
VLDQRQGWGLGGGGLGELFERGDLGLRATPGNERNGEGGIRTHEALARPTVFETTVIRHQRLTNPETLSATVSPVVGFPAKDDILEAVLAVE